MEVMDAIPYNGALMTEVGVLTTFNSDSSEHARRLNTEAAKAVRYGGLSPEEALKFVTINPAIGATPGRAPPFCLRKYAPVFAASLVVTIVLARNAYPPSPARVRRNA